MALARLCLLALAASIPTAAGAAVAVDPTEAYGTWEGWGTSLCWWAAALGDREDLADLLFTTGPSTYAGDGKTYPGLGLTIARYNAGASSWNTIDGGSMVVSKKMIPSRLVAGYWLNWHSADPASDSWDWSADPLQRKMLQLAQARGANKLELFSNSPMWWMCKNHNPSGSLVGLSCNLQDWNYQQHTVYLATVAKYFKDSFNVTFESVEPFNEPSSGWWRASGTQEGCHFDAGTQSEILPLLRDELDKRGLADMLISGSDENSYTLAISTYKAYSDAAKGTLGRINVHGYEEGGGRRDVLYSQVSGDGKRLWNSEYGEGDASGKRLASNLILDFKWLHATAWVYWQAADGGGWGLIQSDDDVKTTGPVNNKFFVLAQFSRHIRPGATIITASDDHTVAAYDAARGVLTLVATATSATTLAFELSAFKTVAGTVDRWTTSYDGSTQYQHDKALSVDGTTLSVDVAADTIVTLEVAASL